MCVPLAQQGAWCVTTRHECAMPCRLTHICRTHNIACSQNSSTTCVHQPARTDLQQNNDTAPPCGATHSATHAQHLLPLTPTQPRPVRDNLYFTSHLSFIVICASMDAGFQRGACSTPIHIAERTRTPAAAPSLKNRKKPQTRTKTPKPAAGSAGSVVDSGDAHFTREWAPTMALHSADDSKHGV